VGDGNDGDAAERFDPVRVEAEVIQNQRDFQDDSYWHLILRVPDWPGFSPGQFVMLSAGAQVGAARTDPLLPRPMAVYRTRAATGVAEGRSDGTDVSILYNIVGRGTALLAEALPGQRVAIVGPLGQPFLPPEGDETAIIVAGGTGIASVYELASRLNQSHRTEVLLGARGAADLMALRDFEKLGVSLRIATEDGSQGLRGRVTELLKIALDEVAETANATARIYTCGPTPMMKAVAQIAAARDVPCIAALENAMACGFGVCLGCAAPLKEGGFALVCREGPALDAATIDWERLP
jgi:dihydroorotate dehydrogenase electron transfer subunit